MIHSNHNKMRMGDKAAQGEKAITDSGWLLFMKKVLCVGLQNQKEKSQQILNFFTQDTGDNT